MMGNQSQDSSMQASLIRLSYSQAAPILNRKAHPQPLIITDALETWPCLKQWTPDFFQEYYGHLVLNTHRYLPTEHSPYHYLDSDHLQKTSLETLIQQMHAGEACYLAQDEMAAFSNLANDYNFLSLIPAHMHNDPRYVNIWLGSKTHSGLHFDYNDNFLAQIYGQKEVVLISPAETQQLYMLPENFTKSQVHPLNLDLDHYPKFKQVKYFRDQLNPGEVLFIPRGWFHHIHSPGLSISLNCWYGSSMNLISMLYAFYRAGYRTWLCFIKDFFWHGLGRKPSQQRLFCSRPIGELAFTQLFSSFRE